MKNPLRRAFDRDATGIAQSHYGFVGLIAAKGDA